MKRITNYIINKRYYILTIFILIAIGSIFLSSKVNINDEMINYLPASSETRKGVQIMEENFSNDDNTSTLNLMFKNLAKKDKMKIKEELTNIKDVSSVNYDDTKEYNKDNYTLYVINLDKSSKSQEANNLYKTINKTYKDYEIYTSGNIASSNKPVLPSWILIVSITCAMIILIILCKSYIEPFLFLATILLAVIINSGTNVIFSSVSNITNSIAAILQMALSMDYSIMLMNRYRQEKRQEKDKVVAMKKALYNAFKAISSSSLTTIVGLLALVFMSFTIGKDLGFVLAKGVLLSLISIFACLPTLILLFDKLIIKTEKKTINFKLNKLANFSFKLKYPLTIIFVLIFLGSYLLKGNLGILYTSSEEDKVSQVFGNTNQIVLIYPNEVENKMKKVLPEIEKMSPSNEVLGYSNTINKEMTYDELNKSLKQNEPNTKLSAELLKILYYKYYNKNVTNSLSLKEFTQTIESLTNDLNFKSLINTDLKNNIQLLKTFTNEEQIMQQRTITELSTLFNIDEETLNEIFILKNAENNNVKLTLPEFITVLKDKVLSNPKYTKNLNENTIQLINKISQLTNEDIINQEMDASSLAQLLGVEESTIQGLYTYYLSLNQQTELTIKDFMTFILSDLITNETYTNLINEDMIVNLKNIEPFVNLEIINKPMNKTELHNLLGIDEESLSQLIILANVNNSELLNNDALTATPYQIINTILANDDIKNTLPKEINNLTLLQKIMDSTINNVCYKSEDLAEIFNVDENTISNIYTLYTIKNTNIKLTLPEFINFVISHKEDELLKDNLNSETLANLLLMQNLIESTSNYKEFTTKELNNLLGIDENTLKLIYALSLSQNNQTMNISEFMQIIQNKIISNPSYNSLINEQTKKQLKTLNNIISASLDNKKFSKTELLNLLSPLSSNITDSTLDMLYIYQGSQNNYNAKWTLTIEEFIQFLNNNILNDKTFSNVIDKNTKETIKTTQDTIFTSKKLLVGKQYSRIIINTNLDYESKETFNYITKLNNLLAKDFKEYYLAGDSLIAYEMSQTFKQEFNFISIITLISIFIVVCFSFKSLIVPLILVLIIQCSVYTTMGILSLISGSTFFLAILIVESILMGATIDYAIVYTSYYLESRKNYSVQESIKNAYNASIHTILTSASILTIVTLIVGIFATSITSKICITISLGTICSTLLILFFLPGILGALDKIIRKK